MDTTSRPALTAESLVARGHKPPQARYAAMPEIQHELKVSAPRAKVITALTDRGALERWHGAIVSGGPQEWRLAYPQGPVFRWRVLEASAERVCWRCVEGPGDSVGTQVSFVLSTADQDRTLIEFEHAGWLANAAKFRKCNTLWALLLLRLQREAESAS
ncbi:MAG: hypothetical protein QM778_38685 [Myxococcales bacterium]